MGKSNRTDACGVKLWHIEMVTVWPPPSAHRSFSKKTEEWGVLIAYLLSVPDFHCIQIASLMNVVPMHGRQMKRRAVLCRRAFFSLSCAALASEHFPKKYKNLLCDSPSRESLHPFFIPSSRLIFLFLFLNLTTQMSSAFPPPTAATGLSALAIISSRFVRLAPEFSSVMLTRFVINHHCIISSSVIPSSTLCV